MAIRDNLESIHAQLTAACARSGRNPDSVRLVAVSKTKPASMINEAAAAGQKIFGESYVQDFLDKAPDVKTPVVWHFIGSLQSNKVKYLAGKVRMIHSVDRLSLAQEIDRQWANVCGNIEVLIQVNLGGEESKSGTTEQDAIELVRKVAALPQIKVVGLMTLPPYLEPAELVRPYFRQLRLLAEEIAALRIPRVEMRELSMGMSHDFEVAVEEGATMVRIGTAIFGEREKR